MSCGAAPCHTALHYTAARHIRWHRYKKSHELNYSTLDPVSTGMGDRLWAGAPPRYVTKQLGQLSLASLRGCWIGVPETAVMQLASPLWRLTRCMGSHPAEMTVPPLPQPIKAGTPIQQPQRDARLSWPSWLGYIPRRCTGPKTVTHPSTNRVQCRVI